MDNDHEPLGLGVHYFQTHPHPIPSPVLSAARSAPANFSRGYCGCIATVAVLTEVVSLGVASVASTALLKVPLPGEQGRPWRKSKILDSQQCSLAI